MPSITITLPSPRTARQDQIKVDIPENLFCCQELLDKMDQQHQDWMNKMDEIKAALNNIASTNR